MRPHRRIGILGGAGAAASAALVTRITDRVTRSGAHFDQDHPELVLVNATKAPSRSLWLLGRGPSFLPAYIDAARRLKAAGADFAVMCCNTAHAERASIEREASIPVLDLVARALQAANPDGSSSRRVGLLCSDGVRATRLYQNAALGLWGRDTIIESSSVMQALVTESIIAVKRGFRRDAPRGGTSPAELFALAADELAAHGAELIILGCTEIPLAFTEADWTRLPLVDTVDLLASMCLEACGFLDEQREPCP